MWQWIPAKLQQAAVDDSRGRRERGPTVEAESELGVFGSGLDELVRVRLDARRHPDVHACGGEAFGGQRFETFELVGGVDRDATHPRE